MKAGMIRFYVVNDEGDLLEQISAPQMVTIHFANFVAGAIVGALLAIALSSCAPVPTRALEPVPAKFTPPPWWIVRYAAAWSQAEVSTGQGDYLLRPPVATSSAAARDRERGAAAHPSRDLRPGRDSRQSLTETTSCRIVARREQRRSVASTAQADRHTTASR